MFIHVCPLTSVTEIVQNCGIGHIVTLTSQPEDAPSIAGFPSDQHLKLCFHDVVTPFAGMNPPATTDLEKFLEFVHRWDRNNPMLIHCWAGISRSSAGAFIALCAHNPDIPEQEIAQKLRASSQTSSPNARMVAIADKILNRGGRMCEAIDSIGRGIPASLGEPFSLPAILERDHV